MPTMRIAIYARVSTSDKGQTTDNQVIQLREHAREQGWSIAAEYLDHASGKSGDRDSFRRMFADAKNYHFDLVLFWSLDRFSREGMLETLAYLRQLTDVGVGWKSYTQQFLDSCGPFSDVILGLFAVLAQQERLKLSERVKAGLERTRAAGMRLGRPRSSIDIDVVRALRAQGLSDKAIGAELGVGAMTVNRLRRSAGR